MGEICLDYCRILLEKGFEKILIGRIIYRLEVGKPPFKQFSWYFVPNFNLKKKTENFSRKNKCLWTRYPNHITKLTQLGGEEFPRNLIMSPPYIFHATRYIMQQLLSCIHISK